MLSVPENSAKATRTVLFGHGDLAVAVAENLLSERIGITAIVTSDGEEGELTTFARTHGLPWTTLHPRKKEEQLLDFLTNNASGIAVMVAVNYRYVLPRSVLNRFHWPLNIHGSLLPRYRGRTPHVWAIINGETETGVTVHVMDEGVDTGPIVAQETIPIEPSATGASILRRFQEVYPNLVTESLKRIGAGIRPVEQDEAIASYFGKRTPEMGLIDFRLPFERLRDFVRAISPPYPGAYCYLVTGRRVVIENVRLRPELSQPRFPKFSPRREGPLVLVRTDDGTVELDLIEEKE